MNARSKSRSAARLAAVQALYQLEMEGTPVHVLLHEFHAHRLGATIEDRLRAHIKVTAPKPAEDAPQAAKPRERLRVVG